MRLVLKDADSGSRMGFAMPELRNCTSSLVSAAQVEMGEIPWKTKPITHLVYAAVVQLAERYPSKVVVASSNPVCRSIWKDTASNFSDTAAYRFIEGNAGN